MKQNFTLFKTVERIASKGWRGTLESARRMMGLFNKILLCVFGRLRKGHCLAVYSMSKSILKLYRQSGPLFTGQYLKQVSFLLMWYVGGDKESRPFGKVYVKTTKAGIPRFIPPQYRKMIRGEKNPLAIQVVMSVCTLSRIIMVQPKTGQWFNPKTIEDFTFTLSSTTLGMGRTILASAYELLERYVVNLKSIPLRLGFDFVPTFSSGPNTNKNPVRETCIEGVETWGKLKTSIYHTLPLDIGAMVTIMDPKELIAVGSYLFRKREFFLDSPIGIEPVKEAGMLFGQLFLSCRPIRKAVWDPKLWLRPEVGRFGRNLEGSGKVRVFAIANPIFQTLLRPLHNWVMDILRTIPMDGTFDQHAPLRRLKGKQFLYSFDLKAATDLLPVHLSVSLLEALFGDGFARIWHYIMTKTEFRSPNPPSKDGKSESFRFTRGQPLGFYSSWPVFTLTHHMLVWLTAQWVYPGKRFTDYAILGDDIVIADQDVAESYRYVMEEVQAVISIEKSLISSRGACEFAKRFIIRNHQKDRMDLSPLSLPLIKASYGYLSAFTYKQLGCSFRNSFRLRGGGYHVFSKIRDTKRKEVFNTLSRRWKRHWLSMFSPSGIHPLPSLLWLSYPDKGYLNCYEEGMVRFFLIQRLEPRELDIVAFERLRLFWKDDPCDYLEYFLTSLVEMRLHYLLWYARIIADPCLPLDYLLSPPVAPRNVDRIHDEHNLSRYGLLFRAWDYLRTRGAPLAIPAFEGKHERTFIYMRLLSPSVDRSQWAEEVVFKRL